jgi:hypothetical protein
MPAHGPLLRHSVIHQRDFDGRTIFQHRNGAKWSYGSANPRIAGFELHDECAVLLAELQKVWNGRVFVPPAASVPARLVEAQLRQSEWVTYLKLGSGEKTLQLLADNRIGEGRAENEFYWWVEEDGEGLLLGFEGRRHTGARLRLSGDGSWLGRSLEPEAWEVRLTPRAATSASDPPIASDLSIDSARALLESILASPAGKPQNRAATGALAATLKVLRQAIPGFSKALADYLAELPPGPGGDKGDDETIGCLRAALAEPLPAAHHRTGEAGPTPFWSFNLGTHYER